MSSMRRIGWLLLPVGLFLLVSLLQTHSNRAEPPEKIPENSYLFCFWNVENLFDDKPNDLFNEADKEFDRWFVRDPKARQQKYDNLASVLCNLNEGRGPDILALAEMESHRSGELLAEAMNKRLKNPQLAYQQILFKDAQGGRSIGTAILTRLPVVGQPFLMGDRQRILHVRVKVQDQELNLLATHWTSRVSDESGRGRAHYAEVIYNNVRGWCNRNPNAKVLICGDFNDNPDDTSVVKYLHGVSDPARCKVGERDPNLLNLFGRRWEEIQKLGKRDGGSHYFRRDPMIFDQILVSPGMLTGEGWRCLPESATIVTRGNNLVNRFGAPLRFGSERDEVPLNRRGCSDHLPVTVRLVFEQKAGAK